MQNEYTEIKETFTLFNNQRDKQFTKHKHEKFTGNSSLTSSSWKDKHMAPTLKQDISGLIYYIASFIQ